MVSDTCQYTDKSVGDWLKYRLVIGQFIDVITLVGQAMYRGLWGVVVRKQKGLEYLYVVYYSISGEGVRD